MAREERLRLSWIEAYRELQDAGAVCRRYGISRPTLRKWLRRFEADGAPGLSACSRAPHHWPEVTKRPSGTHKGTKLERPGPMSLVAQSVTPL